MANNKKAVILQAAYELFLENGYDNTTIKMIAGQAGVAQGHIYSFYPSKELLFADVLCKAQESYQTKMYTAVQEFADLPAEEFVQKCVDVILDFRPEASLVISSAAISKIRYLAEPILKEYSDGMVEMMQPRYPGLPSGLLYDIGNALLAVSDSLLIDGDRERGIRTGIFVLKLIDSHLCDLGQSDDRVVG